MSDPDATNVNASGQVEYGRSGPAMTPVRGFKQRVKWLLLRGIHDRLMPIYYKRRTRGVKCISFHYLFDQDIDKAYELFRTVQKFGDFISTADMLEMVHGSRTDSGRYFHLSIDDGFQNIATNAHPIFRDLKIPYVFFVCTKFAEADRACEAAMMKNAGYAKPMQLADWQTLRRIAAEGAEIGSHTRTHRRLSRVGSIADLRDEIVGAKVDIENRISRPCLSFAWPFGRRDAVDERGKTIIAKAGYQAVFGEVRGRSVYPGEPLGWYFPRTHFEPAWPMRTIFYYLTRSD